MFQLSSWRPALALAALLCLGALLGVVALSGPLRAAEEGHGIERMTAEDWEGMWGFQKRGFAECWLAGKRHQAARTLAELKDLEGRLGAEGPAATRLKEMQAELQAVLDCQVTPKQLEKSVNRFYEDPGNSAVLLGDALHFVVLESCPSPQQARASAAGS